MGGSATRFMRGSGWFPAALSPLTRCLHSLLLLCTLTCQAQRIRARGVQHFRSALALADIIVTPSTPCTAPAISAAAAAGGASDLGLVSKIMRFASQVSRCHIG